MIFHRCDCRYVPDAILENLAKRGEGKTPVSARASLQQANMKRKQRESQARSISMDALMAGVSAPSAGTASREVYDCAHKWEQRGKRVRSEGDPTTADDDVTNAYDFAGIVRDFYLREVNRNSIDNAAMNLILNVHYGTDYMNAFWDGDEMTFGDGDGSIFTSFARSLDVVAHELTHGVTQFTASLEYYSQSGALNEHFSDVFGAAITQDHLRQDAGQADWLVGDEIMGPTLFGEALRSMKMPGTAYDNSLMGKDQQPAHMNDYYTGPNDNQGVHINSGIPNRAFYLVAIDIGTPKALQIWYHALQNLWPKANFSDAVEVIVRSAQILTKNKTVPVGTTQLVRMAFNEVGL